MCANGYYTYVFNVWLDVSKKWGYVFLVPGFCRQGCLVKSYALTASIEW